MDVALVVLCAGDSTRFGGAVKKQWLYLKDEPLWAFCVRRLAAAAGFARVVVAGKNARYMSGFLGRVAVGGGGFGGRANSNLNMVEVEFVEGGATRTQSLKNALAGVENEFVLVSDCARVGVSAGLVRRVLGGVFDGAGFGENLGAGFGAGFGGAGAGFGADFAPNSNLSGGGGNFSKNRAELGGKCADFGGEFAVKSGENRGGFGGNLAQNRGEIGGNFVEISAQNREEFGENHAENLAQNGGVRVDCVVPFLPVSDTSVGGGAFVARGSLKRIQTPQLSRTSVLKEALEMGDFTDESSAISAWFFAKNSPAQPAPDAEGGDLTAGLSPNSNLANPATISPQNHAQNYAQNADKIATQTLKTTATAPNSNFAQNAGENGENPATISRNISSQNPPQNLTLNLTPQNPAQNHEPNSNLTQTHAQNAQENPAQPPAQSWLLRAKPLGANVRFVAGEPGAEKITFAHDLARLNLPPAAHATLVGTGFDVHEFCDGEFVTLGGVRVPHTRGLKAHSDGDAAAHALIDALLGAAGLGDVGEHFPDTDAAYAGADSLGLLRRAYALVRSVGLELVNADITIIAQKPKISPFKAQMSRALAGALGVAGARVSVKATTTEWLGFTGRGEGLAAMASVSLRYFDWRGLAGGGDCEI